MGMKPKRNRLLVELALPEPGEKRFPREGQRARVRAVRSVTVNLAESPLGWLKSRGHVTERQFDAGERLRTDWERAQYAPGVTMRWDASPLAGNRRCAPEVLGGSEGQLAARRRFEEAIDAVGGGLSDVLWR